MQKLVYTYRKLTSGSVNRKIFGAAVTVALMTMLVKVAAVFRELVVAWRFGISDVLDAFFIALLVPSFIISVVAESFNAALIPTYIRVREQEGNQAAQRLLSGTIVWSMGLLGVTTILILATAPLYLPYLASGFTPEKIDLTFHLLCAILPNVLLSGIIVIWSAVLNAGERFALAALSPIITSIITIILLLMFPSWSVFSLAAGLVGGAALEISLLGVLLRKQGISLEPKWYGFDTHMRHVAKQYVPMIAGAFLMCSTLLVDQSMAAMLLPGSVAALNYGNRLVALPINIATQAIGTAVIPYFSKMVADQNWTDVRHTLKHYMQLIFFITVPLTGLIVIFSDLIVKILLQRGSFTATDTYLVAQIQSFNALQIPFYVANILVVKLISALRANYILMYGSLINLTANITLNYLFMQKLGIAGIALSTSCVYMISFSFVYCSWLRIYSRYSVS